MKTIGRKLKAIYLMAVIALVSICMSFIPFMANTVKADDATATAGLRVTGAQVKVIDGATQEEGNSQFAVYFHTEITEDFYNALVGESKQFGMIVGPQAMMSGFSTLPSTAPVADFDEAVGAVVTAQEIEAGKAANFRFVGTDLQEDVVFEEGIYTFEAGVIFDEADLLASGIENALKLAAATKLTAVPYYVVDGNVTINKLDAKTRVAKDILIEEATRVMFECSDSDFDMATIGYLGQKYVGNIDATGEYYMEATTGTVYKANANKELVEYMGNDLGDAKDIAIAGIPAEEIGGEIFAIIDNLADGEGFSMAYSYADGTTKVLPIRVVTKVLSKVEDFFNDADGSGAVESTEMTRANYIFNLMPLSATGACNPTIAIKGYYVLANNIDLKSNGNLCNKSMLADGSDGSGDHTVQIFDGSKDVGFRGTLDGRGFALSNLNPSSSSAGMFGAFYGATVKNIAFYSGTNSAGNGTGLVLGYTYNSTFENIYIRLIGNNNGDNWASEGGWNAFGIDDNHGGSKFTNLVVESYDGLASNKTNIHQRFAFTGATTAGTFTNTAIVGMTVTYKIAQSKTDSTKNAIQLTMPVDAMAALDVTEGEYAVSTLPETAANAYANLIANVQARAKVANVEYVNFVVDTKDRDYYLDSASLVADTAVANTFVETGFWKVVDNALVWASLQPKEHTYSAVVKDPTCTEDGYTTYTCTCGCGDSYISSFVARRHTYSEVVTAPTCTEEGFTTYTCIHGDHEYVDNRVDPQGHTPDAAGELCIVCGDITREGQIWEENEEIVIDKATGKVLKANENNELVAYDATSYLGEETVVTIGGVTQTITNTTAFAFDKAGLASLADGQKVLIVAGQNLLVAQVATKVFFTYADFFTDADGSGTVEDAEMIFDNNFFNLDVSSSTASKKITGYYVLANNIVVTNSALKAGNGNTAKPGNTTADVGFQATLDGRGFAISTSGKVALNNGAGLLGLVKNATIKNIAFIGLANQGDDGGNPLFARYIIDSTFENVYITVAEYSIGWNQRYRTTANAIGSISNSTFTNVIFENNAWKSNTASIQNSENSWHGFGAASTTATYTNVNSVGAPITVGYGVHVAATDTETAKYKLIFTMPIASIQKYVAAPGVYALEDCGGAETDYAKLISGIKSGETGGTASLANMDIQYIEFVAETSTRGYFYDNVALAANTAVANAYVATGCWKIVDNALVWASL